MPTPRVRVVVFVVCVLGAVATLVLWTGPSRPALDPVADHVGGTPSHPAALDPIPRAVAPHGDSGAGDVELRLRDLASGLALPGMRVRIVPAAASYERTSDDRGVIVASRRDIRTGSLQVLDSPWRLPRYPSNEEMVRTGTVWLCRDIMVAVHVEFSGDPPDDVRPWIQARVVGPARRTDHDHRAETPWSYLWSITHGIDKPFSSFVFDEASSTFTGEVPSVRHAALAVGCHGFKTEVLDIPVGADASSTDASSTVHLRVVLDRGPRLTGRLLGSDGAPPDRSQLQAYLVLEGHRDSLNPQLMAIMARWATGTRVTRDDRTFVNFGQKVPLGADGSFGIDLPMSARVVLIAHAEGRLPIWYEAGTVDRDLGDIELRFDEERAFDRVRFTLPGQNLANATLHIGDVHDSALQTSFQVRLDADATCPGEYLVAGRGYWLIVSYKAADGEQSSVDGLVHWDGRPVIEMEKLEQDFGAFRSR